MNLLDVVFAAADGGVADQPAVLRGQHVDMHLLYLLLLVEVCHDCLGAQSYRFVCVYLPSHHLALGLHLL